MTIEVLIWAVRIFCVLVVILVSGAAITGARRLLRAAPAGRHQAPAPLVLPHRSRGGPDSSTGSMFWPEEEAYLIRRDGIVHVRPGGDVDLEPWQPSHGADAGPIWHKEGLWNGHTFGCTIPDEDHPGACPEEGDDPNDPWGWPVPAVPPAEPPATAEGPGVVDPALALAADDLGNAGWTDQLLADLRDAPTVLDHPVSFSLVHEPSRLADTGEIELASIRADYAAELRAQDDETTEYLSRLNTTAAELRLELHGL